MLRSSYDKSLAIPSRPEVPYMQGTFQDPCVGAFSRFFQDGSFDCFVHAPLGVADRSRFRPVVSLGALPECRNGCRATKTPVHFGDDVEPHEPQQSVKMDPSEEVSDLRWLARDRCSGCLGNEYRIVCKGAYVDNGRPEQCSEF